MIGEMSVLNVTVEQGFVGVTCGLSIVLLQDKAMNIIDNVKYKILFMI
jgi:hypothetical protein